MITQTKRTQEEILERFYQRKGDDIFGFEVTEYLTALDYSHALPFLTPEATEQSWLKNSMSVRDTMFDYMPFAWEKANNFRGLSSGRSIQHYIAWLWLDGQDALAEKFCQQPYEFYGKDYLTEICALYGWDAAQWDDGVRQNSEYDE